MKGFERAYKAQRALLRAASFGKAVRQTCKPLQTKFTLTEMRQFLDMYDAEKLVRMCKALRVLNALSRFDVGLPMTHAQLRTVGARGLVQRLTGMLAGV